MDGLDYGFLGRVGWGLGGREREDAHPEINFEVPGATEFSVADLECDGHFVFFVELFVEAFAGVGAHLDVVRQSGADEDRLVDAY